MFSRLFVFRVVSPAYKFRGRSLFATVAPRKCALEEEANANPLDPVKQVAFLQHTNSQRNTSKVIERVESGLYANNEDTLREYVKYVTPPTIRREKEFTNKNIRALCQENKLNQIRLSSILSVPNLPYSGFNSPVVVRRENKVDWLGGIFSVGLLVLICYVIFGRGSLSLLNVSDAHQHAIVKDVKFDDVKGVDEAKDELQEIVEYLRDPAKFVQVGAKLPKGVLMCGPPGTGKTLLARAMAGEAGVPFLYCAGSSFDEMLVGVGSKRVRQLFKDAEKLAPCIIFIDEIDAIGGSRKTPGKDHCLQQLLTELDGFRSKEGIVVIAATNTPEVLDSALVRPGRFDKQVVVSLPDVKGRKQIFDLYLNKVSAAECVDSELLARSTPGFSGADINHLINASAIKAVINGKKNITMDVIDEARDDVLMGRMRRSVLIDPKTREMTAYHEGGHALVAHYTEGADPVYKATIIHRGSALGMVKQVPAGDQLSQSRQQLGARLSVLMAGRAAEELVYGKMGATSGASSDLKQASQLASTMIRKCGFSDKIGMVYITEASPQTEKLIEEEVRDMLQIHYEQAKKLLVDHKEELDLLAKTLLDRETLSGEEIADIFQKSRKQQLLWKENIHSFSTSTTPTSYPS